MDTILNNLNKEQLDAVINTEGATLVLAGAGTGKTRVLTSKIAYIIKSNLAFPSQILALTFTNKAGNEIKERTALMTGLDVNSMWLGTFHSICARILRQNGNLIGLDTNFLIIDTSEQNSIVKQIFKELDIDSKEFSTKYYVEVISKIKEKIRYNTDELYRFNEVFDLYNERLKKENMCDFSDLLLYTIKLLTEHKDIREYYSNKFKYILIDEYQDTNKIQNTLLKLISGLEDNKSNINITCVGDDDQSIYGWRGAEIKNILDFKKDFKNAKIFKLERNYRSTQNILNVAYDVISNNKNRHEKKLYTNIKDYNDKVIIINSNDVKKESINIANEIEQLKKKDNINYKDFAILVRASYQTRIIEDIFLKYEIPYIIIGGLKFYERKEIKDCIAYLRLINNKEDNFAFERIINTPKRGIGLSTIDKIKNFSIENNLSYLKSAEYCVSNGTIKGKTSIEIINFIKNINYWSNISKTTKLKDLMDMVLKTIKYKEFLEKDDEIKNKFDNIDEFLNTLNDFDNISDFLEYTSLVNDNNERKIIDAVNIMTIHSAKGLEFDNVFLPNWQEGVFPSPKSVEEGHIEEERRLAYVAITRAKRRLYISNSKYKTTDGNTIVNIEESEFLKEIKNSDSIEIIDNVIENNYSNYYQYNRYNKYNYSDNNYNNYNNYNSYNKYNNSSSFTTLKAPLKKCFHKKFGYGYIKKEDGDKLTITFEKYGEKVILKSFVEIY